jgi:hypothetical protein
VVALYPLPIVTLFSCKPTRVSGVLLIPENQKKYFPGLGAMNIPVEGFMAFPTLVLVISNGTTELAVEYVEFLCT